MSSTSGELLETKLHVPPLRPSLVPRPRLLQKLNRGTGTDPTRFSSKLTLISAPAGFGKTTLAVAWLAPNKEPGVTASDKKDSPLLHAHIAWLSLDEDDNDPQRFFSYLAAATRPLAGVGQSLQGLLPSPQPLPPRSLVTAFLNDVTAVSAPFILVLDDYHTIETEAIDEAMSYLLAHMPAHMHLVIISRTDPTLLLPRLRARGQLTEIRVGDLRFTAAEATTFLNKIMELNLPANGVAALEARTEGWIAGLQLAALSMQGRDDVAGFINSFTGSHRYVIDYLVAEVLKQQPPEIQQFLLQSAILDHLCGPLCDALLEREGSQAILQHLESANLFLIPLDDSRRWYRYHHLFADVLRYRLQHTTGTQVKTLHRRAARWYGENGWQDEAVAHLLAAEAYGRAAALMEAQAEQAWQRGEVARLQRWAEALPAEQLHDSPQLCIFYAWTLMTNGRYEAATQNIQTAVNHSASLAPALQGKIAATQALIATFKGDVPGIIQHARRALDSLPGSDLTWRSSAAMALGDAHGIGGNSIAAGQAYAEAVAVGKKAGNVYLHLIAGIKLAMVQRQQGELPQALQSCRHLLQLAQGNGMAQTAMAGCLHALWGEILCEWNQVEEATPYVEKGVALCEKGHHVGLLGWSYLCQARVFFARQELEGVRQIMQKVAHLAQTAHVPPWIGSPIAALQGALWLAEGNLAAAVRWGEKRQLSASDESHHMRENEYLIFAHVLIAQGRFEEATALLARLLEPAKAGGRFVTIVELLLRQAQLQQAQGNVPQAIETLEEALALAEPRGLVRIFVEEGPAMAQLLRATADRGIRPHYVDKLLAAFGPEAPPLSPTPPSPVPALVEPLSERELDVLRLIAAGLKNKEIAAQLVISLNTVLFHTKNIYRKLHVNKRTQAVARARELGLL